MLRRLPGRFPALVALVVLLIPACAPESTLPRSTSGGVERMEGSPVLKADPSSSRAIAFTVTNDLSTAREFDYVTSGFPVPRAWQATDASRFTIEDAGGVPVPCDALVTARWGGAPETIELPIKWVLVTFPVSLAPGEMGTYTLAYGGTQAEGPVIQVSEDDSGVTLDTGAARFRVSATRGTLLEQVQIDGRDLLRSEGTGLIATPVDGPRVMSADSPATLTVEVRGPLRTTVRVDGTLSGLPDGPLDYTARLTFYAGTTDVRALITLGNHAPAAVNDAWTSYDVFDYFGKNSVTMEGLSWTLRLAGASVSQVTLPSEAGLEAGTAPAEIYQASSGTDYWNRYSSESNQPRLNSFVPFRGYRASLDGRSFSGDHHKGWVDAADGASGIGLGIHDFWQAFPKGLRVVEDGTVAADLFPERFPAPYNLRVGEETTTEVVLHFRRMDTQRDAGGPDGSTSTSIAARLDALLHPLFAVAAPEWYRDSGAIQPFAVAPETLDARLGGFDHPDDRFRHDYYIDRALVADPENTRDTYYYPFHSLWVSTPGHPSSVDYFDFHGWAWYGDQPLEQESYADGCSGPFDLKYNIDYGAWIEFLRTGDQRWRTVAEAASRHAEALMLHGVETETGWDVARWKNAIFGHSAHVESGNENSVRNHLGPVGDTAFGARGSALHYFLTGYAPSRDFVMDAAEYARSFYQDTTPDTHPTFAPSREAGNVLNLLTEGLRLTGDDRYRQAIDHIVQGWPAEAQPYIAGPDPGSDLTLPTWIFGLYYNALARYAVLAGELGREESRDAAIRQLTGYLDWHLDNATKAPQGWLTTYYAYRVDGDNDPTDPDMVNNWTLLLADATAWAYVLTGDPRYLTPAAAFYHTGTQNPFYLGSPLIFSASKESVNALVFGHVYAAVALGAPPLETPSTTPTPAPSQVSPTQTPEPWPAAEPTPLGPTPEPSPEPGDPIEDPVEDTEGTLERRVPLWDTTITSSAPTGNYGGADTLTAYNGLEPAWRILLRPDLKHADIPEDARIVSATLWLHQAEGDVTTLAVYRVTRLWKEGTGTWGDTQDGATWATRVGPLRWRDPGGDFDTSTDWGLGPNGKVDDRAVGPGGTISFDVTPLVQAWISHDVPNDGMLLTVPADRQYQGIAFAASETADDALRPALVVTLAQ